MENVNILNKKLRIYEREQVAAVQTIQNIQ